MSYSQIIKSTFNMSDDSDIIYFNQYIRENDNNNEFKKIFVEDEILHKINDINFIINSNNVKRQHNMINYLSYLIITLFNNHTHDMTSIDLYDISVNQYIDNDVHYDDNVNTSKLIMKIKNIYNLGYNEILLNESQLNIILSLIQKYANDDITFHQTLSKLFTTLNYYQLLFMYCIKNTNNEKIIEQLKCYDQQSVLYFNNGNFNNINYDYVNSQEKNDAIEYLKNVYNSNEITDYLSFSIKKLYLDNFCILKDNNVCIFNNQLQYLIKIMSDNTMNPSERFSKFCNILTFKQLNYIGV
jgi:hypothetical protein